MSIIRPCPGRNARPETPDIPCLARASFFSSRSRSPSRRPHSRKRRLEVEQLEDLVLLSAGDSLGEALELSFKPLSDLFEAAHVSEFLANPEDVRWHRITLEEGDRVTVSVDTAPYGGGLDSYLRIFQEVAADNVQEIAANDHFRGRDPSLTFQAPGNGTYYIALSSFDNASYDPLQPIHGLGSSHGLFDLRIQKTIEDQEPVPDLVTSSVQVTQKLAVWGDTVTVHFTVQNRGGEESEASSVSLLVAGDNRFISSLPPLESTELPALAAGGVFQGSFTFELGESETPWPPFLESQKIFLGIQIGAELPTSPAQGNDWIGLQMLKSEEPNETNTTLDEAQSIEVNSRTKEVTLPSGTEHYYKIVLIEPGNVTAQIQGSISPLSLAVGEAAISLTLLDVHGNPIVQSNGQSANSFNPSITHGLVGNPDDGGPIYYLKVANLGGEATYNLTTMFAPSVSTLQTIPLDHPLTVVDADFNGDGIIDLVIAPSNSSSMTVLLGNGDGTFQKASPVDTGMLGSTVASGDFNEDGRIDLVATNPGDVGVAFFLGNGDGSFISSAQVSSLLIEVTGGNALAAVDINGDTHLDLAFTNPFLNQLTVMVGDGFGGFQIASIIIVSGGLADLAAQDFNEDGSLDFAVVGVDSDRITILLGNDDGTFEISESFEVGTDPFKIEAGDFNGDDHVDMAVANFGSGNVTVLLGDGNGSFLNAGTHSVGNRPESLVTGDFNGDGSLDLATVSSSSDMMIFLGKGNGMFQSAKSFAVGANPMSLVAADFNGDGHVDVANANYRSNNVAVLLGNGNGLFLNLDLPSSAIDQPVALMKADLNGDSQSDLTVANATSDSVTVLLSQGDGTFLKVGSFVAGIFPKALAAGDFNGDGRTDLAVANYGSRDVTVLLGNGDGTYQMPKSLVLAGTPSSLVVGEFNGDNLLDVAVSFQTKVDANGTLTAGDIVRVFLGNGFGAFNEAGSYTTGFLPTTLISGDFDGDGNLDLATANNSYQDQVTIALGDGQGNFPNPFSYSLSHNAVTLVTGDFDGDTFLDLAVSTRYYYYNSLAVLINDGAGTFHLGKTTNLDREIEALVTGDFNGDGNLDLTTANGIYLIAPYSYSNNLTVLLGNGLGDFLNSGSVAVGSNPVALESGDFNADGRLDIVSANSGSSDITTLLGTGTGTFFSPVLAPNPIQSTPLVANLTGTLDTVVLTQTGQILFRRGLPGQAGAFAPPVVLNPTLDTAARDLDLVQTGGGGTIVAALSANTLPEEGGELAASSTASRAPRVMFYQATAGGFASLADLELPADFIPASLASEDLNGDGLGDLVITAAASDQVLISLQTAPGVFGPTTPKDVGVNPSDIAFALLNDDELLDIVITNRFSGQVSVLINEGNGEFQSEQRFRAGIGLYGLAEVNGAMAVQSLEGTSGLVAGEFDENVGTDVIVINSGTNSFTLLTGDDRGGFFNPQVAETVFTDEPPTAIVADRFITGEDTHQVAILSKDTVTVYRRDANGGYFQVFTASAGNQPTGLSVADVTRPGGGGPDGIKDLVIGNAFGDLLILAGDGLGGFSQYRRADRKVSLAVADSPGGGPNTFYFSNQGSDQLAFQRAASGTTTLANPTVYQDRDAGIQAPGPQTVVTVQGTQYLVVANSGSNELLIYTIGPDGRPDPASKQTYFTGTDPVNLTVPTPANDLNQDAIPDLVVANQGSNDVSIFLGQMVGDTWTLSYRPRQSSGGFGPTAVAIEDVVDADGVGVPDGIPDLLVSNGQSNTVSVLPSRGEGFFINQRTVFQTGTGPSQLLVGNFDGAGGLDLVTVNTGSNNVTLIANFFSLAPLTTTITSGGTFPVAAVSAAINADGINDLLVANLGNGVLEVLLGSSSGFQVAATLTHAALPNLSDLALVISGNLLEVYGADAGRDIAVLLGIFGPAPEPAIFVPQSPGFSTSVALLTSTPPPGEGNFAFVFEESTAALGSQPFLQLFFGLTTLTLFNAGPETFGSSEETEPNKKPDEEDEETTPGVPRNSSGETPDNPSGILLENLSGPGEPNPDPALNKPPPSDDSNQEEDPTKNSCPDLFASSREVTEAMVQPRQVANPIALDLYWKEVGARFLWEELDAGQLPVTNVDSMTNGTGLPRSLDPVESLTWSRWRDALAMMGLWSNLPLVFSKVLNLRWQQNGWTGYHGGSLKSKPNTK